MSQKRGYLIFSLLLFLSNKTGNQPSQDNSDKNSTVHVHIPETVNQVHLQQTNNNTVQQNPTSHFQAATNINNISNWASAVASNQTMQNAWQQIQDIPVRNTASSVGSWVEKHPYKIALGMAASLYAALCSYLFHTDYTIKNAEWAHWKEHISVDKLHEKSLIDAIKQQMYQELVEDILKKHLNPKDPTNRIAPLIQFMITVDKQVAMIDRYLQIGNLVTKLRIGKILPINESKLAHARECQRRLHFVKQLFVAWTASYNFAQF